MISYENTTLPQLLASDLHRESWHIILITCDYFGLFQGKDIPPKQTPNILL